MEAPKLVRSSNAPSATLTADAIGAPGAHVTLHFIPQFEGSHKPDAFVFADRTERSFLVSASLSKAPLTTGQTGEVKVNFDEADGSCYLRVLPKTDHFYMEASRGRIQIKWNAASELSLIEFECTATTPSEARFKFIEAAYPALDHLSYIHNVALFVTMIRVVDLTHHSTHLECVGPYRQQMLVPSTNRLFEEMKPVYSMYREGRNADSVFYSFLCFYKIMEAMLGKMWADVSDRAKRAGVKLQTQRDLVPQDEHVPDELKAYAGKPIKVFFDNVLTARHRNAVAHFFTHDGVLHVSSPTELHEYAHAAFVSDLCARALIARHEQLLEQLVVLGG
jgi:hypothetical protein